MRHPRTPSPPARSLVAGGLLALALLAGPGTAAATTPTSASAAAREANAALDDADRAGRQLLALLDQSRRGGHGARSRCVDRKLSEVNSFARMLVERRRRLLNAEQRGDEPRARHEREVIRRLRAQLAERARQGRACVTGSRGGRSRTVVTVVVDPDVPEEDLSALTDAERRRRP